MGTKEAIIEALESGLFKTQKEAAEFYKVSEEYVSQVMAKHRNKKPKEMPEIHSLDDYLLYLKGLAYNPKSLGKDRELYAKILGWLERAKAENKKEELTADDYTIIGARYAKQLQDDYRQGGGVCPVCHRPKEVRSEPRLDTEPEHAEDREVATVALPARPA